MSSLLRTLTRIPTPRCHKLQELPAAETERARLQDLLSQGDHTAVDSEIQANPLSKHLLLGLAYTTGSALGSDPPTREECFAGFTVSATKSGLMAGAKALSKHAHRSGDAENGGDRVGWWGSQPKGPVASINERAVGLFDKVMDNATWRNLHWLPHQVLVYEVRVEEGYGMRWSQDRSKMSDVADVVVGGDEEEDGGESGDGVSSLESGSGWMFRGFVEPMMENGHELGWKHDT